MRQALTIGIQGSFLDLGVDAEVVDTLQPRPQRFIQIIQRDDSRCVDLGIKLFLQGGKDSFNFYPSRVVPGAVNVSAEFSDSQGML